MLAGMTAGQVAEWEAFFALEPWGGLRDDLRAGKVAAAVVNANPFRGGGAARMPSDFFPTLAEAQPPKARPGVRQVQEKANNFFRLIGGA
jgi:hypothetical protein